MKMRWAALIAALALTYSLLFACNTISGTTCNDKGATKTDAQSHHTYHCQYNPTTGGNTWQ